MLILLTNDDGYSAAGLDVLRKYLSKYYRVVVVAPDRDRSGAAHSLTVTRPLRVKKIEKDYYAVDGTPTDAVMIAVYKLLKKKPDIVISGINNGANMGEDVTYSGTVAAAIEGTLFGIPSIAVSLTGKERLNHYDKNEYLKAAKFTRRVVNEITSKGLPDGVLLNINVPTGRGVDVRKYTITRLGERVYEDVITKKIDPRGQHYYWIAGQVRITGKTPDTDYGAILRKLISVTPLAVDITANSFIDDLKKWRF
ncbi:MAG: 5'/3'-nucleotidase SurE [candidate division Zixibacteria bacterium]|nr:5'/3'-nucleotidase SurE [candidate division Zixibacteria bacterium]